MANWRQSPCGTDNLYLNEYGVFGYGSKKLDVAAKKNGKEPRTRVVSLRTKDRNDALIKLAEHRLTPKDKVPTDRNLRCNKAFYEVIERGGGPVKKKWAAGTKASHIGQWERFVAPWIGEMRVIDLESWMIGDILDRTGRDRPGFNEEYELGISARHGLYSMLSAVFKMIHRRYHLPNPVASLDPDSIPPEPEPTRVAEQVLISREDAELIAANFWRKPKHTGASHWGGDVLTNSKRVAYVARMIFLVLMGTGMRITEALAVNVNDVRYGKKAVLLHEAGEEPTFLICERRLNTNCNPKAGVVMRANDPDTWYAPLKGDVGKIVGSVRRIRLGKFVRAQLAEYIQTGLDEGWLHPGGLLFPNLLQRPVRPSHFWDRLQVAVNNVQAVEGQLVDANGNKRHITTHYTRHSYLSKLVDNLKDLVGEDGERGTQVAAEVGGLSEKVLVERYLHREADSSKYDAIEAAAW